MAQDVQAYKDAIARAQAAGDQEAVDLLTADLAALEAQQETATPMTAPVVDVPQIAPNDLPSMLEALKKADAAGDAEAAQLFTADIDAFADRATAETGAPFPVMAEDEEALLRKYRQVDVEAEEPGMLREAARIKDKITGGRVGLDPENLVAVQKAIGPGLVGEGNLVTAAIDAGAAGLDVLGGGIGAGISLAADALGELGVEDSDRLKRDLLGMFMETPVTGVSALGAPRMAAAGRLSTVERATQAAKPVEQATDIMEAEEAAKTARKAVTGVRKAPAMRKLAEQVAPDPQTVASAERLGIAEHLQPDHVTTNQVFRELSQAVKSMPGSQARAVEATGLQEVAKRANDLISEFGGTRDWSTLSTTVKGKLGKAIDDLWTASDRAYEQLAAAISPKTQIKADNIVAHIMQRADNLGGVEFLPKYERRLLKNLSPDAAPTYARLDDERKKIGQAIGKKSGPYANEESGNLKKLYEMLTEDQQAIAETAGVSDLWAAAKETVKMRKALEDDMISLFGRNLDGTLVKSLEQGVKGLSKGDTKQFINTIKAIPEDMRQDVVMSGLRTAFGGAENISFLKFSRWFDGLKENKQAYTALMSNLPKEAQRSLNDLHRVSKGIAKATQEKIATGRLVAAKDEIEGADNLLSNMYGLAKRSAVGVPAEFISTSVGLPGAGLSGAVSSALTKGKPKVIKQIDEMLISDEFLQLVQAAGTERQAAAVTKFAKSKGFKNFAKDMLKDVDDLEVWINAALIGPQVTGEQE